MTRLVFKSNLSSTSSISCNLVYATNISLAPTTLSSTFTCEYQQGMTVNVFIESLRIPWQSNSTYSIVVNSGFFTDLLGNSSPSQTILYTTGTGPQDAGHFLGSNSGLDANDNTYFGFYFDRNVFKGTSNTALVSLFYNNNGVGVLLNTWTNSQASFYPTTSSNAFSINITGYLQANTNYFFTIDSSFIKDVDGLGNSPIGGLTFTTASEPTFFDLSAQILCNSSISTTANRILASDKLIYLNGNATSYVEDTLSPVINYPYITDPNYNGNGTYTVTVTATDSNALISLKPTSQANNWTFNSSTSTLTMADNKTNINLMLGSLVMLTKVDYEGYFNLTYSVTSPTNGSDSKSQQVNRGTPYDTQVTGIPSSVSYTQNTVSTAFQTIQVSDFDTATGLTWTVQFSTLNIGQFQSNSISATTFWRYTGTKSQVNAELASLIFSPNLDTTSSQTITYTQSKSDKSGTQISQTIPMTGIPKAKTTTYYVYTSTTFPPQFGGYRFIPSLAQINYGTIDILLIGAGGGASKDPNYSGNLQSSGYTGFEGGGAGQVIEQLNVKLTQQTYNLGIFSGGSIGTNGGNTTGFGFTAYGGQVGTNGNQITTGHGGTSGSSYSGGNGASFYNFSQYSYAGGGGGGQTSVGQNANTSNGQGGLGGSGVTSVILTVYNGTSTTVSTGGNGESTTGDLGYIYTGHIHNSGCPVYGSGGGTIVGGTYSNGSWSGGELYMYGGDGLVIVRVTV